MDFSLIVLQKVASTCCLRDLQENAQSQMLDLWFAVHCLPPCVGGPPCVGCLRRVSSDYWPLACTLSSCGVLTNPLHTYIFLDLQRKGKADVHVAQAGFRQNSPIHSVFLKCHLLLLKSELSRLMKDTEGYNFQQERLQRLLPSCSVKQLQARAPPSCSLEGLGSG